MHQHLFGSFLPRHTCGLRTFQALRYVKPPDVLLTQIDVYIEEKYEDEEDLRDRARNFVRGHTRTRSDSEVALEELIRIAKQHGELYPIMVETLKRYAVILEKDIIPYVFLPPCHESFIE